MLPEEMKDENTRPNLLMPHYECHSGRSPQTGTVTGVKIMPAGSGKGPLRFGFFSVARKKTGGRAG